jgi:hypothetical protein
MPALKRLVEGSVIREHSVTDVRQGQMEVLAFYFKIQGSRFGVPQKFVETLE